MLPLSNYPNRLGGEEGQEALGGHPEGLFA
jgi:hypothetical protein